MDLVLFQSVVRAARTPTGALGALVALAVAAGACGADATPTSQPAAAVLQPLDDGGVPGAASGAGTGAVATWTPGARGARNQAAPGVPRPRLVATPLPGGAAGPPAAPPEQAAPARLLGPTPVPPIGKIPMATTRAPLPVPSSGPPEQDPDIVALMARVEQDRLLADVRTLAGFGTRHTLSATGDPQRGIGAAREWLYGSFDVLDGVAGNQVLVDFEDFPASIRGRRILQRNLIATLPGIGFSKTIVYVTAHYDSRAEDIYDGEAASPGADDDASGTAVLLELARVMVVRRWDATIRFAAFAAKEQGRLGSRYHAGEAARAGLPILAVLSNDIVGGSLGDDGSRDGTRVRVYSAGAPGPSRRLARTLDVVARRYGVLEALVEDAVDLPGRSGDHKSFSEAGFAAVRLTEGSEVGPWVHGPGDTPRRIDPAYLATVTRMNLAGVANLALAPRGPDAAPVLERVGEDDSGLLVTWPAVDDPMVAGYWVAIRDVESGTYERLEWAGNTTQATLWALAGRRVAVAIATADDRGHISLFGPEATSD